MSSTVNDPTGSGPPVTVATDEMLPLSRNEVESVCSKAARGAGMSWGLAEEAGYAAGWLVAHGLDGASMLALHLRGAQGKSWPEICPVVEPGAWLAMSDDQPLCPIALGATLSDYLGVDCTLFNGHGLRVGEVSTPALVLPFLAMAMAAQEQAICVHLQGNVVRIDANGVVSGEVSILLSTERASLIIAVDRQAPDQHAQWQSDRTEPATVRADALTFLHELSLRTTVPSSASSRANAGAMGSDND